MQSNWRIWVFMGIVCGLSVASTDVANGQRRRERPGRKPGEVITPPDRGERWTDQLHVGGQAPSFTLPLLKKEDSSSSGSAVATNERADRTVTLQSLHRERPVVLIFGSFTCPPFRGQLEGINEVYKEYQDRAEFLFVYIREAHPDSILSVTDPRGRDTLLKIPQPTNISSRTQTAVVCRRTLDLDFPIAVDTIENEVGQAYAGWPNRMVVVGTDGRVLFATAPSPRGTDARRLGAWLAENLIDDSNE